MERILMITAASLMALATPLPGVAAVHDLAGIVADADQSVVARRGRGGDDDGRGRGRGRGGHGDDDGAHGGDDDTGSGSGRSKPRVPGGSGCDDAGDVAEHGACGG